ncbi:hypothetical protein ACIF6K_03435 [Streptomyces sp. NPDC085942]|uniref:hypothetical protein n=1 Tax=Streptomyces sp. NPDC085942 TaxID=3365743 RepID=UPI0037D68082
MRLRTAAASVALVLGAATGASACSSPQDAPDRPAAPAAEAPPKGLEGKIEAGERATSAPELNEQRVSGPAKCATSAAEIPADCALALTFADVTEGERADGPPSLP